MAAVTGNGAGDGPDTEDGADVVAVKVALRARLLAARRARSAADLAAAREAIVGHVTELLAQRGWRRVAAYEPLRTEPGSTELLDALASLGVEVIVPVTLEDGELDWRSWHPADGLPDGGLLDGGVLDDGLLGGGAIATVDAVLLPALAVARDGTRLGRGRGYYDRALTRCGADVDLVGVVFDDELLDELPAEPWDAPVGWAVRPAGVTPLHRNTAVGPDL